MLHSKFALPERLKKLSVALHGCFYDYDLNYCCPCSFLPYCGGYSYQAVGEKNSRSPQGVYQLNEGQSQIKERPMWSWMLEREVDRVRQYARGTPAVKSSDRQAKLREFGTPASHLTWIVTPG